MIRIDKITKKYAESSIPAVDCLSLTIKKGEIFGLLGTNGAGKTTTFSMLCGIMKPDSGNIFIAGFDMKNGLNEIKKIIGVVPQDIALYPTLTARENLRFFGKMYGLSGKTLENLIEENLVKFNLSDHGNKKIKHYSGGMKRRINLIAGILHRPQVLFLDEPAVGIDAHSRREIMNFLIALNQNYHTTIVYTSHYLEEAEKFCNTTGILDNGKLVAVGNPQKLVEQYQCNNLEQLFFQLTDKVFDSSDSNVL